MMLRRHAANPILLPDPASTWETYNVFNPAVIYHGGLWHMHYRAQGLDWISRIGYAVSADGVHWNRLREPVLAPAGEREARGIEDPRVTEINGEFYMAYTAYGRSAAGASEITPMFARSRNLITWERLSPLVTGEDNKDHVLFPRRLGRRYVALHRRPPQIWVAESDDLRTWPLEHMRPLLGPRPDNGWDSKRVGGAGVPIETSAGWLMLYHAYDHQHVYRLGVALLDRDGPGRVLRRPRAHIFEPEELWEVRGDVPNVVFSCANPVCQGQVHVYYGAADHVIGLATCGLDELLEFALTAA
ncbi:MAG: glycosidase [Anaerolineales bacterium]|nr:glycosidase [Anaerolineales bacterium]